MAQSLSQSQFDAAMRAAEADNVQPEQRVEMLMEIAMSMQTRPKSTQELRDAIGLYQRALDLCGPQRGLLASRVQARLGTALRALPDGGLDALRRARDSFESALPTLQAEGLPQEVAETEMNLGLVFQALAGMEAARIQDAISHYHRALRVFTRDAHPQEYAILHNNLAIAYLSIPLSDERGRMREALAVQSFEETLKVVTLVDHPAEYAMIQNNLGNALQYATSGHPLENNLRALAAYDEALKVRNRRDTPLEYANTIANKANVLRNLPDDPQRPGLGREGTLTQSRRLLEDARRIFIECGENARAAVVNEALTEIDEELRIAVKRSNGDGRAKIN